MVFRSITVKVSPNSPLIISRFSVNNYSDLILEPGASIVLKSSAVINVQKLEFKGDAKIIFTGDDGVDGIQGPDGENRNNIPDSPGGNGVNGSNGTNAGSTANSLVINVYGSITGTCTLEGRPGNGGNGGNGGAGGHAGFGQTAAQVHGGNGGNGGHGGNAGNGGPINVTIQVKDNPSAFAPTVVNGSGTPGSGGAAGAGGQGGVNLAHGAPVQGQPGQAGAGGQAGEATDIQVQVLPLT